MTESTDIREQEIAAIEEFAAALPVLAGTPRTWRAAGEGAAQLQATERGQTLMGDGQVLARTGSRRMALDAIVVARTGG